VLLILLMIVLSLVVVYGALKATGKDHSLLMSAVGHMLKPADEFDPARMPAKPDYSLDEHWLTLPGRNDQTDLTPVGIDNAINNGAAPADVFYIHGTGYTNNTSWIAPLTFGTATEDNAKFSLANEASIFNGCCNIYAPHYREASIFAYIGMSASERDSLLDTVFIDIATAFDYFITHHNQGRPIVIVGHSQGTHLAMRLLQKIDRDPRIAKQIVTAYLIGSGPVSLTNQYVNSLLHFSVCKSATDIHCLVHWDTYGENGSSKIFASPEQSICINPLSWQEHEIRIPAEQHLGAAPISGTYTITMNSQDASRQVAFTRPAALMPEYTWAQCRNGFLYVADQSGTDYEKLGKLPDKSYHGIDLPLFYGNIRANVQQRVDVFLHHLTQSGTDEARN
jgi:pimeloyl-ACP methyl ester carboxylesterase